MKNKNTVTLILFVSLILFLLAAFDSGLYAAPKAKGGADKSKTVEVKAGDCAACHKDTKKLPDNHVATKDMPYDGCVVCHISGEGNAGVLRGKLPGSHVHGLKDIKCAQCHGKVKKPDPVQMSQCVTCHPADNVAKKTANVKPNNPHDSPHYGKSADCNLCHHQHAKSEDYCAQCHSFKFMVP